MLPVVVGDKRAAWWILLHTAILVPMSFVPYFYGMGMLYLIGAVIGGALFVRGSIRLVRDPGPEMAIANFHASLIQLTLLLVGAMADRWVVG